MAQPAPKMFRYRGPLCANCPKQFKCGIDDNSEVWCMAKIKAAELASFSWITAVLVGSGAAIVAVLALLAAALYFWPESTIAGYARTFVKYCYVLCCCCLCITAPFAGVADDQVVV
ncbi:hypothetical protein CAEBREN_04715 [Caenorhabditis brenneri]|uniref:Uncharacterized protein n=1 Tax=Caenorhabditis brenneri TaxID=135651 RepID=G0NY69_CAEBE|nr:hypothetical protein CAEBREN_04715 [Caenorhabditis brenneri]